MKKLILLFFAFSPLMSFGQIGFEFIKLTGKNKENVKITKITSESLDYEASSGISRVAQFKDIDYFETSDGIEYCQYDVKANDVLDEKLKRISIESPNQLLKSGTKAYICMSNSDGWGKYGSFNLRNIASNYFTIVDTPYEAEIIINYCIDTEGRDKQFLTITDRLENTIYKSSSSSLDGGMIPIPKNDSYKNVEHLWWYTLKNLKKIATK